MNRLVSKINSYTVESGIAMKIVDRKIAGSGPISHHWRKKGFFLHLVLYPGPSKTVNWESGSGW